MKDTVDVRITVGDDAEDLRVLSESDVVAITEVAGDGFENVATWIGGVISDRIDELKEERRMGIRQFKPARIKWLRRRRMNTK